MRSEVKDDGVKVKVSIPVDYAMDVYIAAKDNHATFVAGKSSTSAAVNRPNSLLFYYLNNVRS